VTGNAAARLSKQQPAQTVRVVAQMLHLLEDGVARWRQHAAGDDVADLATGVASNHRQSAGGAHPASILAAPTPARGRVSIVSASMADETVDAFWQRFVAATGLDGAYTAWSFGDSPEMATELAQLVKSGPKRATAGLLPDASEEMPQPGDLSVILDGDDRPVCVIRTTAVEVRRFGGVDAEFAHADGEGDRTLGH